jgi:hypothetical protein
MGVVLTSELSVNSKVKVKISLLQAVEAHSKINCSVALYHTVE